MYEFFELNHSVLRPVRALADATRLYYQNPFNPAASTPVGRSVAAMAELFERTTRRYEKPDFNIENTVVDGKTVPVVEKEIWSRPFCRLLHFVRELPANRRPDEKILLVAPMSGHYATLLRGTIETLLPHAEVYITDWSDARRVPLSKGRFGLDDYVDYLIDMLRTIGPGCHIVGVCQPAVPVMVATAVMQRDEDECSPVSMTLMGGPIDTRINPTVVNLFAVEKGIDWFRNNVIQTVPWPNPGFQRQVYPGFLQLSGFLAMNLHRHISAHHDFFLHQVEKDDLAAEKHRKFYDEYMAVMDLTAEFYLDTVDRVFIRHDLPEGRFTHHGEAVDFQAIRKVALLTVEGENDDISGIGQTEAAHAICANIPESRRHHHLQRNVGHYGVFNGARFRAEVAPLMLNFMRAHSGSTEPARMRPARHAR